MADAHNAHLKAAAADQATLCEFDQFSANTGAVQSGKITSVVLASGNLAKLRDTSGWRRARDQLLADPLAKIDLDMVRGAPSKPAVVIPEMSEEERRAVLANLPSQRQSALT
jgi:hypothetical protein